MRWDSGLKAQWLYEYNLVTHALVRRREAVWVISNLEMGRSRVTAALLITRLVLVRLHSCRVADY